MAFLLSFPVFSQNLSLRQVLEISLEKSPDYQIAKNQLESAGLDQKNSFAAFLPSLDFSSQHGKRGLDPDILGETAQTNWVSGASVSLTETFYDNGESYKRYQISGLRYELAKLNHEKVKAQLIRSVAIAYYRAAISVQNLKFTQRYFQEMERLARLVTNQFQQGLKTRKDFLSFKTRAQRGQLDVYRSEQSATLARGQLSSLIGRSPEEPLSIVESERPVLPKSPLSPTIEVNSLYEKRALELQNKIADLELQLARRRFWPEVSLVGAASYGSSGYVGTGARFQDNDSAQWNLLLNVKFNLLDWGVRNRNIQVTRVSQDSALQGLRSSLYSAEQDLQTYRTQIARAAESYKLAKELQKMEEDTFKILESDYRSGRATYLELTTGLANLLDAQNRGQEADLELADLYMRTKYYKGNLNETTVFE